MTPVPFFSAAVGRAEADAVGDQRLRLGWCLCLAAAGRLRRRRKYKDERKSGCDHFGSPDRSTSAATIDRTPIAKLLDYQTHEWTNCRLQPRAL